MCCFIGYTWSFWKPYWKHKFSEDFSLLAQQATRWQQGTSCVLQHRLPCFGDSCICLIVWSLFILGNDHLNSRIAYKVDTSCNILPARMSSWDGQVRPKGSSTLPNTQWAKRIGMSGAFLLGEMSLSWILDWLLQFCAAIYKSGDNWVYPHS